MNLSLVHPEKSQASVDVAFKLEGKTLSAFFEVKNSLIHVNSMLHTAGSQWGLWDWDVVELFISAGSTPYYEFQVSPLGQFFELEIFEPRKKLNREFSSGFKHSVETVSHDSWKATMEIDLGKLGIPPEKLVGNAFSILGGVKPRSHFSLFLPKQETPDFHLPQYFKKLV